MDRYNQKWVLWFAEPGALRWAITLGSTTFYSCPAASVKPSWARHEDKHKEQWKRYWYIGFPFLYAYYMLVGIAKGKSFWKAYEDNPLEVEATNAEKLE